MKCWLMWSLSLAIFCYVEGDTKILRKINILSDNAYRQETFSINNENTAEEELVIQGTQTQSIPSSDTSGFVYRIETIYVADKNGNRVKYKLTREPAIGFSPVNVQLNASTLKSLTG